MIIYNDDDKMNYKTINIDDLVHHVGKWLIRKTLIEWKPLLMAPII